MKSRYKVALLLIAVLLLSSLSVFAQRVREDVRTFDGIEAIRISTVSGDCIVRKGNTDQVEVEVTWSYRPRDSFEPKFRERGKVLRLSEDMYGSNSGHSTWTLTVPDGIEVRFNSASGGMELVGLTGDFSAETASGDIQADECQGEFDFSSASGCWENIRSSTRISCRDSSTVAMILANPSGIGGITRLRRLEEMNSIFMCTLRLIC